MAIRNKPKVSTVIGNVRITNNGRKNKFITDKTNATTIAVKNESTCIPGIK